MALQLLLKLDNFLFPQLQSFRALAVGQLHHIDGLEFAQHFIHLLFAVAGGFAHDQVGKIEEGALVGFGKAVAGLDQGAQVAGQVLFGFGDGFAGHGAQAHHSGAHGHGQLLGQIGAEHAHKGNALLLHLHGGDKGFFPLFVEFIKHSGQVFNEFAVHSCISHLSSNHLKRGKIPQSKQF